MISAPAEDIALADDLGLVFKVVRKEARGARWIPIRDDVHGLNAALALASSAGAFEIGVFLKTKHRGFKYWSSLSPTLLNSSILGARYS